MKLSRAMLITSVLLLAPCIGAAAETDPPANEVRLTESQTKLIQLAVAVPKSGRLAEPLVLNGEVTPNQDRTITVLPRAPGIVRDVRGQLGQTVPQGAELAVIESSVAAESESAFLSAQSRAALARAQAAREESLWRKKISSQQDYLVARQAAAEAEATLQAAERKLQVLGLSSPSPQDKALGPIRLPVLAPFAGTLIGRQVAVGDQVTDASPLFRLSDLNTVWVIGSVFERDIGRVAIGQPASVSVPAYPGRQFEGRVSWISDVLDEKSRTLKIRIDLENVDRLLKPGSFARVTVTSTDSQAALLVPAAAVQQQGNETIIFVDEGNGRFKRQVVQVGARTRDFAAIVEGLQEGQRVVTNGAFALLSELEKSSFAGGD
ncbi:MAG: efflux RND transporter periplasmic adaptor subunit [Proteobacteria bacterium]|nr:efflux RND transporter periplasmic adaptor subunit [Pseudomonadota bacterium]